MKIICPIVGMLLPPLLWWAGGYDFDQRGKEAVTLILASIYFGAVGLALGKLLGDKP